MSLLKYIFQYRFRDMGDFLRNEKKEPLECSRSLEGKTVVISGATSGIGYQTARLLASKGADLICLNRNPERSELLEKELFDEYSCRIATIITDFSSLEQTKNCARELIDRKTPIDVLIHNSGVFYTRKTFSEDGIEMVFQVNHLSSFCLNYMLMGKLKGENRARVIYVNSEGHRFALSGVHTNDLKWKFHFYNGLKSYGAAKTAQLLSMYRFNELFLDSDVTLNAMHPGNVKSNIGENNGKLYRMIKKKFILSSAKEPDISARALYYLSASDEVSGESDHFYNLTTKEKPSPHARDLGKVDEVWNKSLELCDL